MDFSSFLDRVSDLTDLELAVLLCLVAREHSLIETEGDAVDDLEKELRLIAANVFGLSYAVLDCSPDTTVEDFSNGILDSRGMNSDWKYDSHRLSTPGGADLDTHSDLFPQGQPTLDRSKSPLPDPPQVVANVVIAKNFNHCPEQVQIQALELLRTNHILTRTEVHSTPKVFHFIALTAEDGNIPAALNSHFRDHIFLSHFHDPSDGFANVEDDTGWMSEDQDSTSSVIRKSITRNNVIQIEMINMLRQLSQNVTISAEVSRYMQDVVVFLRLHRAVAGGVSAKATSYLNRLVRCLAPLHKVDYVTPSLIALAAKKIYRHRIVLASPENDRSLQYGGDFKAAQEYLSDINADILVEEVLAEVEVPQWAEDRRRLEGAVEWRREGPRFFAALSGRGAGTIDVVVPESAIPSDLTGGGREALRRDLILYAQLFHIQNHVHQESDLGVAMQFCNHCLGREWKSYRTLSDTISKLKKKIKGQRGEPSLVEPPQPATPFGVVAAASAPRGRFSVRSGRPLRGRSYAHTSTAAPHQPQPQLQPSPVAPPPAPVVPEEHQLDPDDRRLLRLLQADLANDHTTSDLLVPEEQRRVDPQPQNPSPAGFPHAFNSVGPPRDPVFANPDVPAALQPGGNRRVRPRLTPLFASGRPASNQAGQHAANPSSAHHLPQVQRHPSQQPQQREHKPSSPTPDEKSPRS